jgi:hypothetical protein
MNTVVTFRDVPARSEEENVDAHESNRRPLRSKVRRAGHSASNGNDELADGHANGAHKQEIAATHLLNEVETWESRCDVDAAVE